MAGRLKVITKLQQGRNAVRRGILEPLNLLTDLVFGGVLERFPRLRFVLAEYTFPGCIRSSVKWTVRCKGHVLNCRTHPPFPRCPASVFDGRFISLFKKIELAFWERTYST